MILSNKAHKKCKRWSLNWVKAYFERRKSSIEGPLTPKLAMTDFKRAFLGIFKALLSLNAHFLALMAIFMLELGST